MCSGADTRRLLSVPQGTGSVLDAALASWSVDLVSTVPMLEKGKQQWVLFEWIRPPPSGHLSCPHVSCQFLHGAPQPARHSGRSALQVKHRGRSESGGRKKGFGGRLFGSFGGRPDHARSQQQQLPQAAQVQGRL